MWSQLRQIVGRRRQVTVLLAVAVAAGLLGGACTSGLVALIHRSIKAAVLPPTWVLGFFALWAGHGALGVLSSIAVARMTQEVMLDLRLDLGQRLLGSSLATVEGIGEARLLAVFTHVIDTLSHSLERLPTLMTRLALLIGLYAYMAWQAPQLFAVFVAGMGLGALAYVVPLAAYRRYQRHALAAHDDHLRQFRALVGGIKELLQNRHRERALLQRHLQPTGERLKQLTLRTVLMDAAVERWGEMYALLVLALMLFVLPGWTGIARAEVGDFLLLLLFSLGPMTTVIGFAFSLQQFGAAAGRLQQIGMALSAPASATPSPALPVDGPLALGFDAVAYAHAGNASDEPFHLGPVSFYIEGPAVLFITGGNGSGKSTLAKLLCGLYAPQAGVITVNGLAIEAGNRDAYRQLFATVFFDFFLFDTLLGLEDQVDDARANELLARLQLGRKVAVADGVFSTLNVSQGQRRRLALLVALLEDRPVYVFDEWAADQDTRFKRFFYRELLPDLKRQGRIVVVITHDDTFYDVADHVLKLVDGRLVGSDSGPPPPAGSR